MSRVTLLPAAKRSGVDIGGCCPVRARKKNGEVQVKTGKGVNIDKHREGVIRCIMSNKGMTHEQAEKYLDSLVPRSKKID